MSGIYVHIPFCKKACTYCDFHFTTSMHYVEEMTAAICKEIELKKNQVSTQIGSIYFGGGTPSVLPEKYLNQIFNTIIKNFSVANDAEITIETNPDDLTAQNITNFRQMPINRFSIGIQSFFNEDLIWMNRAHNALEAENCIKRSQDAGFENLSIDLIYGYPLLSDEKWQTNINKAIELQSPHLSAYALTVEPRTALANAIQKGKQVAVNDDQSANQFLMLTSQLQNAGFEHYEISNYARHAKYAVHNTNYWRGVPYLGIGPSAHGFDGNNRYLNLANNAKYMAALADQKLPQTIEELTSIDRFNEYIMTSLRTMWGIDLNFIAANFGKSKAEDLIKHLNPFLNKNHVYLQQDHVILTNQGKLFADGIAASLFLENEY